MNLTIDTSVPYTTRIILSNEQAKFEEKKESKELKSQHTLELIESILSHNHLSPNDITEIKIFEGPGSFTGLRIGATIGSTLSLLLGIPLNGKSPGSVPQLKYGPDSWKLHNT